MLLMNVPLRLVSLMTTGHHVHERGGGYLFTGIFAGGTSLAQNEDARAVAHNLVELR